MNYSEPSQLIGKNLNFFKAKASKLQKQLAQADLVLDSELRNRLAQLELEHLLETPDKFKRKHALNIIANEAGFADWSLLKARVELETALDFSTFFCSNGLGGFLNHWFTSYQEAKLCLEERGGLLLPYRHQFFVTPMTYLEKLGFEQSDEDWKTMGYDWVNPANNQSKLKVLRRLVDKWVK